MVSAAPDRPRTVIARLPGSPKLWPQRSGRRCGYSVRGIRPGFPSKPGPVPSGRR